MFLEEINSIIKIHQKVIAVFLKYSRKLFNSNMTHEMIQASLKNEKKNNSFLFPHLLQYLFDYPVTTRRSLLKRGPDNPKRPIKHNYILNIGPYERKLTLLNIT